MFMLNNSRNSKLTIILTIAITAVAIFTLAVAPASTIPTADRSYDHVEQLRALHSAASGYDLIEQVRIQRAANALPVAAGYDLIEQVRMERTFHANGSYDQIENLRLSR